MRHVRVVVSYDVIARADDELDRVTRYLAAAQSHGAEPLVTFEHSRGEARECEQHPRWPQCRLPTPSEYERAFLAFRERFRTCARTRRGTSPTTARSRPGTRRRPPPGSRTSRRATATAARSSSATCSIRPTIGSRGDRRTRPTRWVQRYRAALRTPRDVCGLHNYSDVNRFRTAGTRALMRALGCRRYWLTETGGIMSAGGWPRDGGASCARPGSCSGASPASRGSRACMCTRGSGA